MHRTFVRRRDFRRHHLPAKERSLGSSPRRGHPPGSQASGAQGCEGTHFCGWSHPALALGDGSPRKLMQDVTGRQQFPPLSCSEPPGPSWRPGVARGR